MVTITLHCPHCGSEALCVMGMPSTGNRNITVIPVGVAVVKTLPLMPIQKLVARKFCMPKDVSTVVGGHSRGVSSGALFQRLLGGICGGDPTGAAYRRGKRERLAS